MITPTSSTRPTGRSLALVVSPPGTGKTTFAATMSADAPPHLSPKVAAPPADAPMTVLRDMAWIGLDRNALSGFTSLRLDVPLYYDLSGVAPNRCVEEVLEVIADIAKRATPNVVFDTGTAFDIQLNARHAAKLAGDKFKGYDAILSDWLKVLTALRQLDANIQILAHVKAAYDADAIATQRRREMDIADYAANITGQSLGRIRLDCDFILPLKRKVVMEGTPARRVQRVVMQTQPNGNVESKIRGGAGLPDEMDADWRVLRAALAGGAK